MAQRRPGEHLCPALSVPRVRLPAGDEQRGLARDAEVRHSGARSHRLRAVAGAARPRRASWQPLTRHTATWRKGTCAVSSWSRFGDEEGVTSFAVLPNGVCSRSECGLLPSLWRCVSFCPISHHKSSAAEAARGGEWKDDFVSTKEFLEAPEELRQPVVGVGGAQEEQGQERLAREVDQDPEGGLTRQCNARLRVYFFFLNKKYHKTSAAGFFTEPLEPDTGKPCENSLKTHLTVPLFF